MESGIRQKGSQPLVSVIVPTYNRPDFLDEALNSIQRQTYKDFEVIVINDGGEDILSVITPYNADYKIVYIKLKKRKGPSTARNAGLKMAKGKYIAYLDDDDIYYCNHLETLVGFLEKSGNKVAYSDSYQVFQRWDGNKYVITSKRPAYGEDFDRQRLLVMNYIPILNIVHRKDCLEEVGLFDEGLETHEDWDLWIRMSQRHDFQHIKYVTAEFRTRTNFTSNISLRRSDFLRTMRIIHSRYSHFAANPSIIKQQKYVEDDLEREIFFKEKFSLKPDSLSTVITKKGNLSLKVRCDDGSLKTLHSLYDPEAEAKALVDAFQFDDRGILIVLGLGLGYHVAESQKKFPNAEIVVVEAVEEIYHLAAEHGPKLDNTIKFIVGHSTDKALEKISWLQMKSGMSPIAIFSLSSAVSAFPDYYRPILSALENTVSLKLWDRLRYPKLKHDRLNIAIIDFGYFLNVEVEKTIKFLGHNVAKIKGNKEENPAIILSRVMKTIIDFKPDFILAINHLGFDEEGILSDFLKSIEMPAASWYVDSPNIIVKAFSKNASPYVSVFLWDKTYINDMKDIGFEYVDYLPLATDENVFKPINIAPSVMKKYGADVGFVGNSMVKPVKEKCEKIPLRLHPIIEKLAQLLSTSRISFKELLNNIPEDEAHMINSLSPEMKSELERAVLRKATLLYRLFCIKSLKEFCPVIYGDRHWKELLHNGFKLNPQLHYYTELPLFYSACKINFNATNLQMPEAVNQRVFDVPACGSFLLTDHQKAIEELFEVGREIVTYKNIEEIPELVRFYLNNPDARKKIAMKGMERVLKEHTYKHRLGRIIEIMRARYK
jgi:spore maturation protein CgeB